MASDNDNLKRRKINEQCMLLHYMGAEARSDPDADGAGFVGLRALNESCKYTSFIPIKGEPTEMMRHPYRKIRFKFRHDSYPHFSFRFWYRRSVYIRLI